MVRMRAASLNFRDVKIFRGSYQLPVHLPLVPLSDGAGEIVAVGDGVEGLRVGDRVVCLYWEGWRSGAQLEDGDGISDRPARGRTKSAEVDGVALERAVYDACDVLPIPDEMSYEAAACLPCAGVTAWNALIGVTSGDTVLVMGSGGVSLFALQIARARGARVIATSRDEGKRLRLQELGASETVNTSAEPEWGRRVRELTGDGVDLAVDVIGDATVEQTLAATRDGGRISAVGNLSGSFISGTLLERGITARPVVVGSRRMTEELIDAMGSGGIRAVIDRSFAFGELPEALDYLASGDQFGKVLLRFDEE
ncbi:zinc-dependent alcohol dehydrogenase family protein [Leucobacter soli]